MRLSNFHVQETQDFLVDNFDHKAWINKVLQSTSSSGSNVDGEISSIILNLQRMLETANQEVETIFHEVAQNTPRILRDIESVNQQAILLKDHMDSVENDFRKMHIDDNGVIRELERLDCERQRAKKAADALREANRWSMLVNSRQALMEGEANVDQLFQLIVDMDQSLVYMEQMPDYAERKALVSSTKDRLETLIAPQLMELLDAITQSTDSRLIEELEHVISMFSALNRSSVAVQYYITWLSNHMKEDWEKPGGHASNSGLPVDQEIQRIRNYYSEVISFLKEQMQFQLFKEDYKAPLLKALVSTLEGLSPQIRQMLFAGKVSSSTRLNRCGELFKIAEDFAHKLCSLFSAKGKSEYFKSSWCSVLENDASKLQSYFDVVRNLCIPLGVTSELFKTYALENMQEYTDDTLLLNDLQLTSDRLLKHLGELLNCAVVQTKKIALPSFLDVMHEITKALFKQWNSTLDAFASHLIQQDKAMKYEQACGMNTSLSLVAATGSFSRKFIDFVKTFDRSLSTIFRNSESTGDSCSNMDCPFHALLLPLIGEAQPCADWTILLQFAPQTDWLKAPVSDASEPITPSEVLLHQLADLCKAAVTMAQRVALTPVDDILSAVPKLSIWASNPASGEATLPDLAYLPQEYITQLGQYIFNLPEHLLPFMDTNEDTGSAINIDQGVSLVHCLKLTDSCKPEDQITSVTSGTRSRLTSSSSVESVSSPAVITAWLDWLLSGQVAENFVKAILEIPSPLRLPGNGGKTVPGLTNHGSKQLVTDLEYFLGLLEELGLPQPGDLARLRDLLKASPEEFKSLSSDKPARLVAGVINLRML